MSANEAETPTVPATATPAAAVMSSKLAAAERCFQSWFAAELVDEVDVGQPVAVHVGDRQAVAVVVVHRLVGDGRVIDDAVLEREAARRLPIAKLEVVERREAGNRLGLRRRELLQPRHVPQLVGDEAERALRRRGLRRLRRAARAGRQEDGRRDGAAGDGDRHGPRGRQSGVAVKRVDWPGPS